MPDPLKSPRATLYELQQPEKLQNVLAGEKKIDDDCLACRLTGAAAFGGLGVYSYFSGHGQLLAQRQRILKSGSRFGMRSRQAGVTFTSLVLVGLGLYRLVN